jgi:hypothetical protein
VIPVALAVPIAVELFQLAAAILEDTRAKGAVASQDLEELKLRIRRTEETVLAYRPLTEAPAEDPRVAEVWQQIGRLRADLARLVI